TRGVESLVVDEIYGEFNFHRSLQCIAVQFAIALGGMPVTNKEQRARPVHRQVNSDALDNFVEVHVSAKAARITRGHRAAPRRRGDAPEHRTKRHSEALKVIAGTLAGRNHTLAIEVPANIISGVLEFHGHVAVNGAVNDGVIADGVIAIQANAREVYGE